jgi:transposase
MAGRDRSKDASLAASRTLNPHPEAVTDPGFTDCSFFDAADLVQVKYEMVRAVQVDGSGVGAAAAAFGLARQSFYNAKKALAEHGLAGLIPAKPGPKGGHKLTSAVVDFLEQHAAADPALSSTQLAAAIAEEFGVSVHRRSVERALANRRAARLAAEHELKEQAKSR